MYPITAANLGAMLKQASEAHHAYEQSTGKPDPDWPLWYASWILARVQLSADLYPSPSNTSTDVPSAGKGYL